MEDKSVRNLGSGVAATIALLTGTLLAVQVRGKPQLALAVAGVTVGVAGFAAFAGRAAGARIARHGWPAALGIGALGGVTSLLAAAVLASAAGTAMAFSDGLQDPYWVKDYLVKPFVTVLAYGTMPAVGLGAIGGLLIRAISGRTP